jgi:hypothetical protein
MPPKRRQRLVAASGAPVADLDAPPVARLKQRPGAQAALMPTEWRDPDDVTPGARRTPRTIAGWRTYCPLRKMSGHPNSGIGAQHIHAADMLREQVDIATMGYSGARPLIFVTQSVQPRWGLTISDVKQMRALRSVRRVVALFDGMQLRMLDAVVLRNITLRQWIIGCGGLTTTKHEKRRLMTILDRLSEYYDAEIENDLASGRRLP